MHTAGNPAARSAVRGSRRASRYSSWWPCRRLNSSNVDAVVSLGVEHQRAHRPIVPEADRRRTANSQWRPSAPRDPPLEHGATRFAGAQFERAGELGGARRHVGEPAPGRRGGPTADRSRRRPHARRSRDSTTTSTATWPALAWRDTLLSASRRVARISTPIDASTPASTGPSRMIRGSKPSDSAASRIVREDLTAESVAARRRFSRSKIAVRISLIVRSRSSTASPIRSTAVFGSLATNRTVLCSNIPVAKRRWITVSWRSRAIRSRSSTTASWWTLALNLALSIATPAAAARPTTSSSSSALNVVSGRLVGQVEVAEDLVAHQDRHAEKRLHRRVVGWKSEAVGMPGEIGQAQRTGVGDEQTEDPVTLGEVADLLARRVVDPDGDELGEAGARLVEHAERTVRGVDEVDGTADDAAEHRRQVEVRADRQHGVEQLTPAALLAHAAERRATSLLALVDPRAVSAEEIGHVAETCRTEDAGGDRRAISAGAVDDDWRVAVERVRVTR